jgi:UrcA family protein
MSAIRIIIASALLTTAAIKAAPALAEPAAGPEVNVSIVQSADLDLSTDAGRKSLDRRLVHAASDVCGTASDSDLVGKNRVVACRRSVLADARGKSEQLARQGNPIAVASR